MPGGVSGQAVRKRHYFKCWRFIHTALHAVRCGVQSPQPCDVVCHGGSLQDSHQAAGRIKRPAAWVCSDRRGAGAVHKATRAISNCRANGRYDRRPCLVVEEAWGAYSTHHKELTTPFRSYRSTTTGAVNRSSTVERPLTDNSPNRVLPCWH